MSRKASIKTKQEIADEASVVDEPIDVLTLQTPVVGAETTITSSATGGAVRPNNMSALCTSDIPNTARLMEAAIRLNPFEMKFKEANKRLSEGDSGVSPSATHVTLPSDTTSDSSADSNIGLKLPMTLTSQSPGLFSHVAVLQANNNPVGPETAEITKLLQQIKESPRVPQTADVLNAVIDMQRGLQQNQQQSPLPFLASLSANTMQQLPSLSDSREPRGHQQNTISLQMPNVSVGDIGPPESGSGLDTPSLVLSLQVGGQRVQVPLQLSLNTTPTSAPQQQQLWSGDLSAWMPDNGGPSAAKQPRLESPPESMSNEPSLGSNQLFAKGNDSARESMSPSEYADGDGSMGVTGGSLETTISAVIGGVHDNRNTLPAVDKKQTILERNKAAAVRYRQRKKEEYSQMVDRVGGLEQDKLSLSTQVQVLRRELDRVNNLLRERESHCTCGAKQRQRVAEQALDEPIEVVSGSGQTAPSGSYVGTVRSAVSGGAPLQRRSQQQYVMQVGADGRTVLVATSAAAGAQQGCGDLRLPAVIKLSTSDNSQA